VYAAHSYISFHAWGSAQFDLPKGATSATLLDDWDTAPASPANGSGLQHESYAEPAAPSGQPPSSRQRRLRYLSAGDLLLLKEVLSPTTGQKADADCAHRHVVRLTRVMADMDPVYEQPIVHIEWADVDALPFTLTVSGIGPAPQCKALGPAVKPKNDVSVACGNIVLVDHGRHIDREVLDGWVPIAGTIQYCATTGRVNDTVVAAGRYQPKLKYGPLTFRCAVARHAPATQLLLQDPRAAMPQIQLTAIPGQADGSGPLFSISDLDDASHLALVLNHALHDQSSEDHRSQDLLGRIEPATIRLLRHLEPSVPIPDVVQRALGADLQRLLQEGVATGQADGSGALLVKGDVDDTSSLAVALIRALRNQSSDARRARDLLGRLDPATIGLLRQLDHSVPVPHAILRTLGAELRRMLQHWKVQPDLLESHADDLHYVAEIDDDGYAHLRFGDGDCGKLPDAGTQFFATYRVGLGAT
jgi:hypothetical protein